MNFLGTSTTGALPVDQTLPVHLRTQHGTKAPAPSSTSSTGASSANQHHRTSDLFLGLGLMAIPVFLVCAIHFLLTCQKMMRERRRPTAYEGASTNGRIKAPTNGRSNDTTSGGDATDSTPPPPRRPKSKSVTWQSPFETKARTSHRSPTTQRTMAASELHFVMVATPEKANTPVQQFLHKQQRRYSRTALPPRQLVFTDDTTTTTAATVGSFPQFRLDRLDSSSPPSDRSRAPSSLSLGPSPPPVLQDSGEYDSESPRFSMSSVISDDPELVQKVDEAMERTQKRLDFSQFTMVGSVADDAVASRLLRCSSSLDDFRHDLHHESANAGDGHPDPDCITRSSEYSF